jgi:hypothetical protein
MTDLNLVVKQIESELKFNETGIATVTIRGAARLADVEHSSLIRAFEGGAKKASKLAESLIQSGFNPGVFSDFGIPDNALALILTYYAFDAGGKMYGTS